MLNHAPNVYKPVEPEDNGIALPVILSLVVHGAILAFVVFSHHIPKIKTPPSIETSIITPEELAQMQAQISANRAAMATTSQVASTATVDSNYERPPAPTVYESRKIGSESTFSKGISSIFGEQNDTPTTDINPFEDELLDEPIVNNPLDIEHETPGAIEPETTKKPDKTANPMNNQGQVTDTFTSAGSGSTSSHKVGASSGDINGALISLISKQWSPPKNRVGTAVAVSVTVDEQGNVINADAHTEDQPLKHSLETAVYQSSPLLPLVDINARRIKLNFVVE